MERGRGEETMTMSELFRVEEDAAVIGRSLQLTREYLR